MLEHTSTAKPLALLVLDRELHIQHVNAEWFDFMRDCQWPAARVGSQPSAALYESFLDLFPQAGSTFRPLLRRALTGETVRVDEMRVDTPAGATFWDMLFIPPIEASNEHPDIKHVTIEAVNVTDRVLSRHVQDVQARVAESLHDMLHILNVNSSLQEVLNYIVAQATDLFGLPGVAIYQLYPEHDALIVQASHGLTADYLKINLPIGWSATGEAAAGQRPVVIPDLPAYIAALPDDPERRSQRDTLSRLSKSFRAIMVVPLITHRGLFGTLALFDAVARPFSEDEVDLAVEFGTQAASAVDNILRRVEAGQAGASAERTRLAHDLHDAVAQTLFSANLVAEVLENIWTRDPDEGRRKLAELRRLTRGALAEMRSLLTELRPMTIVRTPLVNLLRQLTDAVLSRMDAQVHVNLSARKVLLHPDAQIALYRIAQEALSNVMKHSHAGEVWIDYREVQREGRTLLELRVADNGCGFDMARASGDHFGLSIFRERAQAIGATITVESTVDQGTVVEVLWALPDLT